MAGQGILRSSLEKFHKEEKEILISTVGGHQKTGKIILHQKGLVVFRTKLHSASKKYQLMHIPVSNIDFAAEFED